VKTPAPPSFSPDTPFNQKIHKKYHNSKEKNKQYEKEKKISIVPVD